MQVDFMKESIETGNEENGSSVGKTSLRKIRESKPIVQRIRIEKIDELVNCLPEIVVGFTYEHPCLIPAQGYFIEKKDREYYIYVTFSRGSKSLIKEFNRQKVLYDEPQLIKYFYSLASGVNYLHSRKIYQNNIQINDILLDECGNAKLSCLGVGKCIKNEGTGLRDSRFTGIISYHRNQDGITATDQDPSLVDSWNLGLVMLELSVLKTKLFDINQSPQEIQKDLDDIRKSIENQYGKTLLDLIFGLLSVNPSIRSNIVDVKTALEEEFQGIINEEFKASLGLRKESEANIEGHELNFSKELDETKKEALKRCRDEYEEKSNKINDLEFSLKKLEQRLLSFHRSAAEKVQSQNTQIIKELERAHRKHNEIIQTLKRENSHIMEKHNKEIKELSEKMKKLEDNLGELDIRISEIPKDIVNMPKKEKARYFKRELGKVVIKLQKQFANFFEMKGKDSIKAQAKNLELDDQMLIKWIEYFITNCSEGNLNEYLTKLEIGLERCQKITDVGISSLGRHIRDSFMNLQHLELDFECCDQITDRGVESLGEHIGENLINLQHLYLNFSCSEEITDSGVIKLAENIGEKLQSLLHLELIFYNCAQISDKGLKALAEHVGKGLTNLQHLQLDFGDCEEISNEGFQTLCEHIGRNLNNLKYLHLDFRDCEQITDTGMNSLGEHLEKSLTNLQQLHLDFRDCKQITDKGLMNLGELIGSSLVKLISLHLDFGDCEQITETGVKSLSQSIEKDLINLQHLHLSFGKFFGNISEDLKKNLTEKFIKTIVSVNIV